MASLIFYTISAKVTDFIIFSQPNIKINLDFNARKTITGIKMIDNIYDQVGNIYDHRIPLLKDKT